MWQKIESTHLGTIPTGGFAVARNRRISNATKALGDLTPLYYATSLGVGMLILFKSVTPGVIVFFCVFVPLALLQKFTAKLPSHFVVHNTWIEWLQTAPEGLDNPTNYKDLAAIFLWAWTDYERPIYNSDRHRYRFNKMAFITKSGSIHTTLSFVDAHTLLKAMNLVAANSEVSIHFTNDVDDEMVPDHLIPSPLPSRP